MALWPAKVDSKSQALGLVLCGMCRVDGAPVNVTEADPRCPFRVFMPLLLVGPGAS
jgi:hypothetical protein